MENKRELPMPGEYYRHFKGNLYEVLTVAAHSETEEKLVIYRALYGSRRDYARPLDMFLSEVDHDKYPDAVQRYRFERVGDCVHGMQETGPDMAVGDAAEPADPAREAVPSGGEAMPSGGEKVPSDGKEMPSDGKDSGQGTALLIRFLNAEGLREKLEVIRQNQSKIDERFIDGAAVALDIVVREGALDDRLRDLCRQLQLMAQYETRRLR